MQPELWQSLASLMDALQPPAEVGIRLTGATLDLPLEVSLRRRGGEVVLLGSPPRWRWATAFDDRPARLRVELVPEAALPLGTGLPLPPAVEEEP